MIWHRARNWIRHNSASFYTRISRLSVNARFIHDGIVVETTQIAYIDCVLWAFTGCLCCNWQVGCLLIGCFGYDWLAQCNVDVLLFVCGSRRDVISGPNKDHIGIGGNKTDFTLQVLFLPAKMTLFGPKSDISGSSSSFFTGSLNNKMNRKWSSIGGNMTNLEA